MRRIRAQVRRATGRGLVENLERRVLLSTVYVDASRSGGDHDGSSWANAYQDLQMGLAAATSGDSIRVADGTYTPTAGTDRTVSFQLKDGVAVYGGYAGYGAADAGARDLTLYPSILSGDIGTIGSTSDNSYHVVASGSGITSSAILDGFTITGGNANGGATNNFGGGMYNDSSSPTLSNVTFSGNTATWGGGMSNISSSPALANVTFGGNTASYGGGTYNEYSSPMLSNVTFSGSRAHSRGGGMYNVSSSPTLTNVTFSGNTASFSGGGMYNYYYSSPTLSNVTFSGNTTNYGGYGGGMHNYHYCSPTLSSVTFSGNTATYGGGMDNYSSSPVLTNATFSGNSASTYGGGIHNRNSSPTLTNCIIWGSGGSPIYSDSSTPVITYSDIQGGYAGVGNIDADPLFVDADGADNVLGTADDDLRLRVASPGIDAGNNGAVPAGVTTDLAGKPRFADVPTRPNTGLGTPPVVDMGAYEYEQDPPPALLTAASRKTHGARGDLDLGLSLTGTTKATGATIEPRKDGPTQILLNFSEPIQAADGVLDGSEFLVTNASFAGASIAGSTLTVNLSNVQNTKYVTVSLQGLSDLTGNALAGDSDVTIGALYGDIDQSGSVNLLDFQRVKLNLLQSLTTSNFLADLDGSGQVNLLDFQVIKVNLLKSLSTV